MAESRPTSVPTATEACPACETRASRQIAFSYENGGHRYELQRCSDCGTLFVLDPIDMDYSTHTDNENAIRDYVEMNAAVDIIGANALCALKNRPIGRMLDIGCGYGFGADTVRRLAGWDVIGVEPSAYGRRGAKALGLKVYHEIIDDQHPLARERFDAIFSSEVIEHVDDPRAFLKLAHTMLRSDGLLVIGTPDAAALDEPISDAERLAILSPGAHRFLLTRNALTAMLRDLGFEHIEMRRRGTSIVAYASTAPITLSDVSPIEVGRDYARAVLADEPRDPILRSGLLFRLFRYLADLGQIGNAAAMLSRLPAVSISIGSDPQTFDEFMDLYPASAGPLVFYRAIVELNHFGRFRQAADLFLHANLLCEAKMRAAPTLSVVESNLRWSALYHAGVASRSAGDTNWARALWTKCAFKSATGPQPEEPWASLAKQRLAEA